MKKAIPILITLILIGIAGWGVYLLATRAGGTTDNADDSQNGDDTDDTDDSDTYAYITDFEECEAAGFPVQESYPARCTTPDGRSFTQIIDDDDNGDGDDADDGEETPPVSGDTAYTLSDLTAEAGAGSGEYTVTVKVTTAGAAESYAQGYTYSWKVDSNTAVSNTRASVSAGEYTHHATIHTTKANPTIKFVISDPYSGETVEVSALLQDLL